MDSPSYERAIYGYLAGDVEHVAPVLKTWEDFVWVMFHALLDSELDKVRPIIVLRIKYLSKFRTEALTQIDHLSLPLPAEPLRPKEIFDLLLSHSDPKIR